ASPPPARRSPPASPHAAPMEPRPDREGDRMPGASQPARTAAVVSCALAVATALVGCPNQVAPPPVAGVTVLGGDRTLVTGESADLTAAVSPPGAHAGLTWESEEPAVATVDGAGTTAAVTAVAPGTTTVTAKSTSDPGKADAITVTVVAPGAVLWTRQFGTAALDLGARVATGPAGRVVVAGGTLGALEGASAGARDAYVRVYGPDGGHLWTRQFGTTGSDDGLAVAFVAGGDVLVAGHTFGDLEGMNLGIADGFVRRYGPDGDHVWTRQF